MPFVVVAHYYAKEGKARSQDDPRKFLLYEQYRSREDYEAHKATPYFQEKILNTVVPMLESRVPEFYDLIEPE
jgi:quinol monooxygenase YgiN